MSDAYIWIRATLDWSDPSSRERIFPEILPRVELWDETFAMPYTTFRAELRRIAQSNLERVEGAAVTTDWDAIPAGALVLPVDDDDWFAPDAVSVLAGHVDERAVAYRWEGAYLERPTTLGHRLYLQRRRVMPWLRPYHFCITNNYALPKTPDGRLLAENHLVASQAFAGTPGVVPVPGRLSIMNRTLASQTTLRADRTLTRPGLLRRYRGYRSLYRSCHPSLPPWSHEYVDLVAALMQRLEPAIGFGVHG